MKRKEFVIASIVLLSTAALDAQSPAIQQLIDNAAQIDTTLSVDRSVYFPLEVATILATVTNPTSSSLLIPAPFTSVTGCIDLVGLREDGTRGPLGADNPCGGLLDNNTPTTVFGPGEKRTAVVQSYDNQFDIQGPTLVLGGVPQFPGVYSLRYYEGEAIFQVVSPQVEASAAVRIQDGSYVDTATGQTLTFPLYMGAFSLRWNGQSYVCVAQRPTGIAGALSLGNFTDPNAPYRRIAVSANPIASMTLTSDAASNLTITWKDSAGQSNSLPGNAPALSGDVDPLQLFASPPSASLQGTQTQQFSVIVANGTNGAVNWSVAPDPAAPAGSQPGTISPAGLYTAPSNVGAAQYNVIVTATSQANLAKNAAATVTLTPAVAITLSPLTANLVGGQSLAFVATVSNATDPSVTWAASPQVGTLDSAGLYMAPSPITSQQIITVTATSVADPTKSASASITLTAPIAVSLAPLSATLVANQTAQFTATVTGSSNTGVTWAISPNVGSIGSSGLYKAPASITSQPTVIVTATSVADPTRSALATVSLYPPVANLSITPSSQNLFALGTQQFTALAGGMATTYVNWTLSPAVGAISNGWYTGPAAVPAQTSVTVTATSTIDATKSAHATVSLGPLTMSISPSSQNLNACQTQGFSVQVNHNPNTSVTWAINPSVGKISTAGVYTAPASITGQQNITITATSVADPTKSISSPVTLHVSSGNCP
jgi:hypothetical protein